jgi:uncharacterized delta-60 repeat protein
MSRTIALLSLVFCFAGLADPLATKGRGSIATQIGPSKDNAYAVAVQPDGKIIAVGASVNGHDTDFAVARYMSDGTLDASFGEGGVALFDSRLGDDKAFAVLIQPDGKILAAGTVNNGKNQTFAVLRFLEDGTLDPNFARNGVFVKDFGRGDSVAYSMLLQGDGKIVIGGYASNGKDLDFAMTRIEKNGVLDFNFGRSGLVTTALGDADNRGGDEHGYAVLQQADGKLLLAGYSEVDKGSVFVLVRYMPSGLIDRSFGVEGSVVTQIGKSRDRAYTALLQSDGKVVLGGSATTDNLTQFALARYLPNGILDPSFGVEGIVTTTVGHGNDVVYSLALQDDGKIVAAGSYYDGTDTAVGVTRYLANGQLDTNFGEDGRALQRIEWKYSAIYGIAMQSDGKIVAAGVSSPGREYHLALARYLPTGSPDKSFGGPMTQVARGTASTPITAELGLPGMLLKNLLQRPEP